MDAHYCTRQAAAMHRRASADAAGLQTGQAQPQPLAMPGIHLRQQQGIASRRCARQNPAPGVHRQRMAKGAPPARMFAALGRGYQVRHVLHRPRAAQKLPVRLSGLHSEGRWRHYDVRLAHGAKKLRESQVIAHRQADAPQVGVHSHRSITGAVMPGLIVRIAKAEQVHLVIARQKPPVRAIKQAGGARPTSGAQCDGAAHQMQPMLRGPMRQRILHRPAALVLGARAQGALIRRHQGKAFRQRHQPGTGIGGALHQPPGPAQVVIQAIARLHLQAGGDK